MAARDDTETSRRDYKSPYTPHHPVPNIHRYREEKAHREAQYSSPTPDQDDANWTDRAADTAKAYLKGEKPQSHQHSAAKPYPSENKNTVEPPGHQDQHHEPPHQQKEYGDNEDNGDNGDVGEGGDLADDTSESAAVARDPKERRKQMKKRPDDPTERTVTDPVTHLPITIHDFTKNDLNTAPENEPASGNHHRTATGTSAKSKDDEHLQGEASECQAYHSGMEMLFPPPAFDNVRAELASIYKTAAVFGLGLVVGLTAVLLALARVFVRSELNLYISTSAILLTTSGVGAAVIWAMRDWIDKKVAAVWDDELWEAERQRGKELSKAEMPESTQWLNSLLASIWPLVNPDLFTSLVDTLEVETPALSPPCACFTKPSIGRHAS